MYALVNRVTDRALHVPLRFRIALMLAVMAAVFAGLHHVVHYRIAELTLLAAVLFVFLGHKPLVDRFLQLQLRYQAFIALLVVAFLCGHLLRGSNTLFPFVGWTMYGRVITAEQHEFYLFEAHRANDERVVLDPAVAFAGNGYRVRNELRDQAVGIETAPDDATRARRMEVHESTLAAAACLYNQRNPNNPIEAFSVYKRAVPRGEYEGALDRPRELLWTVSLEECL